MLAYCDKIADAIRKAMIRSDPDGIIGPVGQIKMDLHPVGWILCQHQENYDGVGHERQGLLSNSRRAAYDGFGRKR